MDCCGAVGSDCYFGASSKLITPGTVSTGVLKCPMFQLGDASVNFHRCPVHNAQQKFQNTAFSLKIAAVVVGPCTRSISLCNRKMIKGRVFHTATIIQI